MTEKLYDIDSYIKEFCATVGSCKKNEEYYEILLDKTAFFPEAGGQGSDQGSIENVKVLDVQINQDEIIHITDAPLTVGQTVCGVIDWERRFDFMQQHSGEHIVSGVAHSLYGCENVGFHLGQDIVTLDFDKPLNAEQISKIEELANKAVFENKAFYTYYPDEAKLKMLDYRSKKELLGSIRIVEIEDTDICACCAPHVKKSGEIGIIKLLGVEKLRGGVRIEIKCGKRALMDYSRKHQNISEISNLLCVKQNEAAIGVKKLTEQNAKLKFEMAGFKRQRLAQIAEGFKSDSIKSIYFEDDLDMKELQFLADLLYKKLGGIRAVATPCEDGFFFAFCGEPHKLDEFFVLFKANFNVRGGGRNGMVQGTVFALKQELIDFFAKL